MINLKLITQAVESLLKENLTGYQVERNPERPEDPWKATASAAWVGIYKGDTEYKGHAIGGQPWLANVNIIIEVQVASFTSEDDCEDRLLTAEAAVLSVINSNRQLSGTVDMVEGYTITYAENRDTQSYFQAAIITVRAQVRTS